LVNWERAVVPSLKIRLKNKLVEIAGRSYIAFNQMESVALKDIGLKDGIEFFSDWLYSAIYTALDVKELRTVQAISERIEIKSSLVERYLSKLEGMGLVVHEGDRWLPKAFYLTVSSRTLRANFGSVWREKARELNVTGDSDGTFITAVGTMTSEDFSALKQEVLNLLNRFEVSFSKADTREIAVLALDFFRLGRAK
ncbi:MAG: DUF4423 domain-containing protein, partial [Proteobacteria bacterium]